tara:strand:+ start:124 stop:840 length:717 start_codon:yes stop_codon:yes gene_type:complete
MIKKLIALAAVAILSACVTTTDAFNEKNKIGTVYSGSISVPHGEILLPPGDWTVVGRSISKNNNSHAFGDVALAKIDEQNNLDGIVMYSTALETTMRYYFYASDYCDPEANTLYYEENSNNQGGLQQCFFIEDWTLNVGPSAADYVKQAEGYFKKHDIKKPPTMLFSNYRISRRNKLLVAQYGFNYRQPVGDVIPGYAPSERFIYDRPFGTELWKANLETVISWTKENEQLVTETFLN